jgi:hypothetical protein
MYAFRRTASGTRLGGLSAILTLSVLSACGQVNGGDGAPAACAVDYDAAKAQEIVDIKSGEAVYRRVIVDGVPEEDLTPEEIAAAERMEEILADRARPVDMADLAVLEKADAILAGPDVWDRADDRDCAETDTRWSLFCALHRASIEVTGEYEHRRTALQEVRFSIEEIRPGVEYGHRLMEFNNEEATTFDEVKDVLETATSRVRERLDLQASCALGLN